MTGYYKYLCELLEPLRVYATQRGTVSGSELFAAGAALDEAAEAMEHAERESVLPLAEGEGLSRRERLFSRCPASPTTALRREAIAALSRINDDCFTLDAINATISGCGIHALAEEMGNSGVIRVTFPNTAGVPEEFRTHILGAECCAWSEVLCDVKELEYKTLHRLPAFAEAMEAKRSVVCEVPSAKNGARRRPSEK